MGGRGATSRMTAHNTSNIQIKPLDGIEGSKFSSWIDVSRSSNNTIWTDGSVHGLLKNDEGSTHIKGDKKVRFALLNLVNTAVVHLRGIDPDNYTKRELTKLNNDLKAIKEMGFDTPKIHVQRDETIVYAKRKLFTKRF